MQQRDIKRMAHTILEQGHVENDYIEYKKSAASKDKILKTAKTQLGNEICLLGTKTEPQNERMVLVIGIFHGDEPQGKFLIEEYLKRNSNKTAQY